MPTKVATFLAHALAMENEASERYAELADMMAVHNNADVAEMFRQMSEFSHMHALSVRQRASGHELPRLKSWEFRWNMPEPPEVGDPGIAHYLMRPWHALAFALENERKGMAYYATAAQSGDDAEIRALAAAFADEEAEHVATLERWLARTPEPEFGWCEDPDPAAVID